MHARGARHTERLEALLAFCRDGLGLPEHGGFRDHAGYNGVVSTCPRPARTLEFTSGGGHPAPDAHPESLLVLYLGDAATVEAAALRPARRAREPDWAQHGLTFADRDGFRVVLAPAVWPE